MAVQITQNISETKFLESFNNQEVRFKSSTNKIILRASITISVGAPTAKSPTV